jgi:hypothetical protein
MVASAVVARCHVPAVRAAPQAQRDTARARSTQVPHPSYPSSRASREVRVQRHVARRGAAAGRQLV